jgi:hypothetical protein
MVVLVELTKVNPVGAAKFVYPVTLEDAAELPPAFVATKVIDVYVAPLGNPVIVYEVAGALNV